MLPVEAQITALHPAPGRFADRHGHAAVFEGAGRVQPFELDPQLEPAAQLLCQARHRDQRGVAFQQGDLRRMGGDIQQMAVLMKYSKIGHGVCHEAQL